MKAARRQELRTNELSIRLDRLGETFKRNSSTLVGVVAVAMIIVAASYWYSNHKAGVINQGLERITYDASTDDTLSFIERCKSVASENISPDVTRAALLRIGAVAMSEFGNPQKREGAAATKPAPSKAELTQAAREAFTRLLALSNDDKTARGAALFGLGLLDEDEGKFDSARERYNAIKGDKAFEDTPFVTQADFRLPQLANWARPVVFAAPPPPLPLPEPTAGATTQNVFDLSNTSSTITPLEIKPQPAPSPNADTASPPVGAAPAVSSPPSAPAGQPGSSGAAPQTPSTPTTSPAQ